MVSIHPGQVQADCGSNDVNETPEDVMVFLASEQSRWLTSQLLYVGGDWRIPQ
ncbi:MAG: hypothetical protein OCD02_21870 [Spirochaetaceae bacterium]